MIGNVRRKTARTESDFIMLSNTIQLVGINSISLQGGRPTDDDNGNCTGYDFA